MEVGLDRVTSASSRLRDMRGRVNIRALAEHSRDLMRRSKEALLLAAVVGAVTGLGVAGFDSAVTWGVDAMNSLPLWATALAPLVGLDARGRDVAFRGS